MPYTLPARTLRHLLLQSTESYAALPALTRLGQDPLTYADLGESVKSLSAWLAEQGVAFGDNVAILGENCPHWGIAYFAITTMGAVAVPILTEFHPDAIAHIIRHSAAKVVFVSEKLLPKIEQPEFNPAPLFVHLETFSPIEQNPPKDRLQELKEAGLREFRKLREKAMAHFSTPPQEPGEEDLAAIIYTSGTTGHSKGVMLTHRNIVSNVMMTRNMVELFPQECMISILPLAHTFECTLGLSLPISQGMQVVYLDKPPTPRVLLPALAEVQPQFMLAVPLVMEKMYKSSILPKLTSSPLLRFLYRIPFMRKFMNRAAGKKLREVFGGRLRVLAIGGAPLSYGTELFLHEAKFPYSIGYGLTETSPLLSACLPHLQRVTSAGKPVQDIRMRIANVKPETGEGEIQVQGPSIMRGYYKDQESTALAFEDGWLRTGDLGFMDKDGYVYVRGRSKNMILGPSGENIYPEEVESLLMESPLVLEALVYQSEGKVAAKVHLDGAKMDEAFGSISALEMAAKRSALLQEIRETANMRVSSFAKIHKILEQPEPFEKTPTHKIKRYLYVEPE